MFESLDDLTLITSSDGEMFSVDKEDPNTWPPELREQWQAEQSARAAIPTESERPSRLITRAEIAALPPLEPLVEGYLSAETPARLLGAPGSYKSFLALDWACCIATGRPWHGHAVKQGTVVYLVGEGARGIDARLTAWETHYNDGRAVEGLYFFPETINLAAPHSTGGAFGALSLDMLRVDPVLIVIDTQARYTPGADENSSKELGLFVNTLDQLQRFTNAAELVVHHVARGTDHGRGTTAVEGAMQTELLLTKKRGEVALSTTKQKDGDELAIKLVPVAVGASIVLDVPGAGVDPLTVPAAPRVNSDSPVHERLAAVLYRTFNHGTTGGTRADIKSALQGDDLRIEGDARKVTRRYAQAWSRLEELDAIEQVEGRERFMLKAAFARTLDLESEGPS